MDKLFIDKMTGSSRQRPQLQALMEYVHHEDNAKGVIFKSIKENLS
ncbi:hypothetical protein ACSF86_09285 [Moraxella bovoculi]